MITDYEYRVYDAFLMRLTAALRSDPEWHEKELDLSHAWLHEQMKTNLGRSPRDKRQTAIYNQDGVKFNFGQPCFTDKPAYRFGTSEQLKRDNFFFQRFNKEKQAKEKLKLNRVYKSLGKYCPELEEKPSIKVQDEQKKAVSSNQSEQKMPLMQEKYSGAKNVNKTFAGRSNSLAETIVQRTFMKTIGQNKDLNKTVNSSGMSDPMIRLKQKQGRNAQGFS